jgi:hypothetical protein
MWPVQASLNYRGLHIVGWMVVLLGFLILLPFVFLIGFCLPHIKPANWIVVDFPSVDWISFLNIMFWCGGPFPSETLFRTLDPAFTPRSCQKMMPSVHCISFLNIMFQWRESPCPSLKP